MSPLAAALVAASPQAAAKLKRLFGDAAVRAANVFATRDSAASVLDKLNRYFRDVLGFTRENATDLASQIVFNPNTAIPTQLTQHGQKYVQRIVLIGANGRVATVQFVWIRNHDRVVRLVTSLPRR